MWDESFHSDGCCPYQDTGIMLGEALTTGTAEDGCTQGVLRCVLNNGFPVVELKIDNSCPKVRISNIVYKAKRPRVKYFFLYVSGLASPLKLDFRS